MRLLKFALFIPTIIVAGTSLTCEDKCMKKEKMREDLDRCKYVLHNFPKKSSLPPIHYQDLYRNDSQTTVYTLIRDRPFCEEKLMGMVMDIIVYLIIFIWFIHSLRYQLP
jgi:hypothetical protein